MRGYPILVAAAILAALCPPAFAWRPGGVELLGLDAEPRPVSDLVCRARPDGGLVAYLLDQRDGTSSVYVQAISADGVREWTPGGVLGTPGRANEITEFLPSEGPLMLARRTWDGLSLGPWRVAALDDRGAVSTGWPAEGHVVSPPERSGELAVAPRDVLCPIGFDIPCPVGAYVAWISDPDANGPGELRLHALDGGLPNPAWPADGLHVADIPGEFEAVWLVRDYGDVYVVWACKPNRGYPPGLFVARVTYDGAFAPGWSFGGLAVSADLPYGLRLARDAAGGLYLVWSTAGEPGQLPWRTLVQRITGDGRIADGWPATGALVARTTMASQTNAASDGLGGLYVAWTDPPSTTHDDHRLVVRRLDGTGARHAEWPADDLLLASSPGTMTFRLLPAGAYGFHAAVNAPNGFPTGGTLRLHRRLANSAVASGAPASGQPLAPGQSVSFVDLLDDHQGGTLVVWSHWNDSAQRGGAFAQRFGPTTQPTPAGQRPALVMGAVYPQPASGLARFTLSVGQATTAEVVILDLQGRVVRALPRALLDPGPRDFVWDGRDDRGDPVRSGVYFATVRTLEHSAHARIVIAR